MESEALQVCAKLLEQAGQTSSAHLGIIVAVLANIIMALLNMRFVHNRRK